MFLHSQIGKIWIIALLCLAHRAHSAESVDDRHGNRSSVHPAAARSESEPKSNSVPSPPIARFKVAKDGDALLLPVQFNGREYLFLLDTYCACTAFDASLPLGDPQKQREFTTGSDRVSLPLFKVPAALLGTFNLQDCLSTVAAVDLSKIREVSGYEIFGLIGMDFLNKHVLRIDFDKGELLFLEGPDSHLGSQIDLIADPSGVPAVRVQIGGQRMEPFVLNTGHFGGNNSGAIRAELADELIEREECRVVGATYIETVSGLSSKRLIQGRQIVLGNLLIPNPIFHESGANFLSLAYLSRFVVTLDFPNRRMYLQEGKAFNRPDRSDASGLHVIRRDDKTIVHSVDNDSPATKSGIRSGDAIRKIGEIEATRASLFDLRRVLSGSGTEVRVVGNRGGTDYDVLMTLE